MIISKLLVKINKRIKAVYYYLYYAFFWNATLRSFMEGYLIVTFVLLGRIYSGRLNWKIPILTIMSTFNIFDLVLVAIVPVTVSIFLWRNFDKFSNENF